MGEARASRGVKAGVTTLVQDELAYHIFIQATAQDVWDALTGRGWTQKYGYRTLVVIRQRDGTRGSP